MGTRVKFEDSDINNIIDLYVNKMNNIKQISDLYKVSTSVITRRLKENNIELTGIKGRYYRTISEDTKEKIRNKLKGKSYSIDRKSKMKWSNDQRIRVIESSNQLPNQSLNDFRDIEKIKILIYFAKSINKKSKILDFIHKFYNDAYFCRIYNLWIESGRDKWLKPSLDHVIPKSLGGSDELENLEIITWFENRTKTNMSRDQWNDFRDKYQLKSDLFK